MTPHARFWAKVAVTPGCWLWTGQRARAVDGYGRFRLGGVQVVAHRWAWENENGPVPVGLVLDHLCRNRLCVRPACLEPVTPYENFRRGESPLAEQLRQTHCKRGHPLSGDNVRITNHGRSRRCNACRRLTENAQRAAKRT